LLPTLHWQLLLWLLVFFVFFFQGTQVTSYSY
jgi:hypothetical protein